MGSLVCWDGSLGSGTCWKATIMGEGFPSEKQDRTAYHFLLAGSLGWAPPCDATPSPVLWNSHSLP